VLSATGGREGVELLRTHGDAVRLVLLDVTMPEMDGETAFVALREVRPDVRVLVSSGYAEPAWRPELLGAVAGFVAKPYRIEDLERAVRAALEPVST
jgi:two-component system cell cycle sensor histidine kinase/response regulator CckA